MITVNKRNHDGTDDPRPKIPRIDGKCLHVPSVCKRMVLLCTKGRTQSNYLVTPVMPQLPVEV